MNLFRLVLCLAGLAAYLVVKQWVQSGASPDSPARSVPSTAPASEVPQIVPSAPNLQAVPHQEVPKVEPNYAGVGK